MNDGRETGLGQNDVGGTASSVGGALYCDTNVGTGQGRSVVGTITSHGAKVTETLEAFNDLVLVLGEDTSETIGIQDHLVERGVLASGGRSILQNLSRIHVVAQTETTSGFLGDSELVTGNHLDLDTESHSIVDSLLGIFTGRVEDGEETDKFETVALSLVIITLNFLKSDSEGTKTTHSEFFNISLESVLDFLGLVAAAKLNDNTGHTLGDTLELAGGLLTVGNLGTLIDGVKWLEVENLDASVGLGWLGDGTNDTRVNGILVLGTGSVGSQLDDIFKGEGAVSPNGGAIDGELVGGEGTGLVRAQDSDGSQLLNSSDTGDDGLVLGELLSTNGEGDGQDGRHGDGDTTDQEDEDVVETITVSVVVSRIEDENLEKDEDADGDETEGTDLGENLLQVASGIVVLTDQRSSTSEEGVCTGRDDNTLCFTLLTG